MFQTEIITERKMKCKVPVVILTVMALVFAVLSFAFDFFDLTIIKTGEEVSCEWETATHYFTVYIFNAINIITPVLLLVYALAGFSKIKMTSLATVAFAMKMIYWFMSLLAEVVFLADNYGFEDVDMWRSYSVIIVQDVFFSVMWILPVICSMTGLRKKAGVCIILILEFILVGLSFLSWLSFIADFIFDSFIHGSYYGVFGSLSNQAYFLLFDIGLFLFALTNRIPAIIKTDSKRRRELKMKPEKALNYLFEIYSFGEITEEEYVQRRFEVLNRI